MEKFIPTKICRTFQIGYIFIIKNSTTYYVRHMYIIKNSTFYVGLVIVVG